VLRPNPSVRELETVGLGGGDFGFDGIMEHRRREGQFGRKYAGIRSYISG
jgi:hypothetical protein